MRCFSFSLGILKFEAIIVQKKVMDVCCCVPFSSLVTFATSFDNNLLNGTPAVYQNQAVLTVWGSLYRFIQCGGGSFLFLAKRFGAAVFFVYLRAEILIFYRAVI